jgi:hypothetical protein
MSHVSFVSISLLLLAAHSGFAATPATAPAATTSTAPRANPTSASEPSAATEPAPPAVSASTPLADSLTGDAKVAYSAARLLYEDGDFAGAATKLAVAYRLSQDPRLLWNMAAAEKSQRHYARVIELMQSYLATGSNLVTPEDRQQGQALLEVAKGFVSSVTFDVQPAGATIEVGDRVLGTAPLPGPVPIDFGKQTLRISKSGFSTHERTLNLDGGSALAISVTLPEESHTATLKVVTDPNASIRVDGKVVGVGAWTGPVPSGTHTVQLERTEAVPQTLEVALKDGETRSVDVRLQDANRSEPSHTKVPTWVWITGGVVAAAAVGTGAYFLFRKDQETLPIKDGSWGTLEF